MMWTPRFVQHGFVAIAVLVAPAGLAFAGQLSDFEDGTVQGWTSTAAFLTPTTDEASEGSWSLKVEIQAGGFNFETLRHDGLDHHPEWLGGNTEFLFDYKVESFTDFLQVRAAYNPNAVSGTTESNTDMADPNIHLNADGNWHTFSWSFPTTGNRAPNAAPGYFIEWIASNGNGLATIYVDNFRTAGAPIVPEPASIAMLMAGCLSLVAARRKSRNR